MTKRILIADKDKNNREFFKKLINSIQECEISEVDEARDFLNVALNKHPDLIIMDTNIHQQNYEKLIEIIRTSYTKEKLPIVTISYAIDREKVITLLKLGITDFILKPLNNESVAVKIKTILEKINGSSISSVTEKGDDSGKARFLLVDHDKPFRNQFIKLFNDKYEIYTADNGEEGLAFFEKYKPEFVFISEHLKLINERILVQKIRSISRDETKIYFLSTVLKSSAMKSSLYNGVIEKSISPSVFQKEFAKVVWGEEINLFQKVSKIVKGSLLGQMSNFVRLSLAPVFNDEINVFTPGENFKLLNEALASVELIDEKKELSVTVGIFGSSKDMLLIAEKVAKEPVSFNALAVEAIGGVVTSLAEQVNQFIGLNGVKLDVQQFKVNSRLENKLNYDWDIEAYIKDSKNSHYAVGVYCSKII
ncbi:MAG: response regulator [Bacillota bacterium]